MAVKSSGSISILNDIVAEFGGTAPHSLSEYYGGAGLVPAGANPSVPASGQIKFSNMYGSVAATVLSYLSNTNNVNIATDVVSAGGDLNTPVILTIGSGVTIGSTSSSNPAMTTGTGWGAGTTINITNNGSIVGASGTNSSNSYKAGGNGGNANSGSGSGGTSASGSSAQSENNGGTAFYHAQTGDSNLSVIFDTAGTRTGGSAGYTPYKGGGGGGGAGATNIGNNWSTYYGGGGGGGAGSPAGSGGSSGGTSGYTGGQSGSGGSLTGGGGGGSGASTGDSWICAYWQSNGGNGGSNGNSGSSGQNGQRCSTHPSGYGTYSGGSGGGGGSNYNAYGSSGSALGGNTSQIS